MTLAEQMKQIASEYVDPDIVAFKQSELYLEVTEKIRSAAKVGQTSVVIRLALMSHTEKYQLFTTLRADGFKIQGNQVEQYQFIWG